MTPVSHDYLGGWPPVFAGLAQLCQHQPGWLAIQPAECGCEIGFVGLGQFEQTLQVDRRRGPEPLELAFGLAQIARVAQAMADEFGLLTLHPTTCGVERLELIRVLTLASRLAVGFIGVHGDGVPMDLALHTAGE
jgi:hypothetical protein